MLRPHLLAPGVGSTSAEPEPLPSAPHTIDEWIHGYEEGATLRGFRCPHCGFITATWTLACPRCGTVGLVAELAVYRAELGTVVRCRVCDNVLMVFVEVRGVTCVDLHGLAQLT